MIPFFGLIAIVKLQKKSHIKLPKGSFLPSRASQDWGAQLKRGTPTVAR